MSDDSKNTPAEDAAGIRPEEGVDTAADAGGESGEDGLDALQDQVNDLRDRLLRAVADADNTRKRAAREVKETREYAVTGFARDMLDIADNLERALGLLGEDVRASLPENVKPLVEGVEMTQRRLMSTLERHGVKRVAPEPGDPLDPNLHQAAAQIPADQPKGRIAHVMQPGYVIGERTLRAAMVVVSAGPAEGAAPAGAKPASEPQTPGHKPGSGLDVEA
ncbi:co-chaperone GrpE [Glycocaulis alkaliphilus]|uniref:Protein GrpE n=1 Tax=Glycocaulis alkaliphilus TaxID=1434191 RepID=A0A3T0E5T3_9PROT|nr:nucleotide exchange factor GrpE [Glycocaulis alkaliphilus]AZU02683.1 co-chaperone GrpE [Glycocaulis alkaliphilus]GGB79790.1 protein GrpE [Glycocaulis alkaliphilus]